MFVLKKIISQCLYPLTVGLAVAVAGIALLWFTARQKLGKILVSVGIGLLLLLSMGPVSNTVLSALESAYAPFPATVEGLSLSPDSLCYIVVLGGGHSSVQELSASNRLGPSSLGRLVEAIRIHRMLPQSKLVLSGGGPFSHSTTAEVMREAALGLGVLEENFILEASSFDTYAEARAISDMVKGFPVILVTSASHMRRAMALFRKQGINPIPAPTNHRVQGSDKIRPHAVFPSDGSLENARIFIKEIVGYLWAKMRGQV